MTTGGDWGEEKWLQVSERPEASSNSIAWLSEDGVVSYNVKNTEHRCCRQHLPSSCQENSIPKQLEMLLPKWIFMWHSQTWDGLLRKWRDGFLRYPQNSMTKYIYIHTYIHIYIYMWIAASTYICIYACMYIY